MVPLVASGTLPSLLTSTAYQRNTYSPEVIDAAVRNWAQTTYEVADFKVFPTNSTLFQNAFPGLTLYEVVELTRHPATAHAMAWNNTTQTGYDVTRHYNNLIQAFGPVNSASQALVYAKALADAGNVEIQPRRQVLNASDSTWLGLIVSDPTVTPTLDGWKVEAWTWSVENGVVAKWEINFGLGLAKTASWNVTNLRQGPFERHWEAFRLLPGTLLSNTYLLGYSFAATRTTSSGTVSLLLESDVENASYTTVSSRANIDGSQWVASFAGNISTVTGLADSLTNASVSVYSWQVRRNQGPSPCSNISNPKTTWNFTSQDSDCQLEIRIVSSNALFCGACVDAGNQTRIYVTENLSTWMTTDLDWYHNSPSFNLTTAARTVASHLHLVYLKSNGPHLLPDVDSAPLPGDQLTPGAHIDPEHFFFQAVQDDEFWNLSAVLSDQPGFLGLAPALNGSKTLHALFNGTAPQVNASLPDTWRLDVSGNTTDIHPILQCPNVPELGIAQPWDGIGPGSKLLSGQQNPPFCGGNEECTANFIFSNSTDLSANTTTLFLGTAAHCAKREGWVLRVCVSNCVLGGETGYLLSGNLATLRARYVGNWGDYNHPVPIQDFALLEIPPALWPDVRYDVPIWGGPTGIECPPSVTLPDLPGLPPFGFEHGPYWMANTSIVLTYGNGVGVGEVSHSRAGLHQLCEEEATYQAIIPTNHGDSGGPLVVARPLGDSLVGGGAYGILSTCKTLGQPVVCAPVALGPTIARAIKNVQQDKGWSIYLVCPDETQGGRICGP